MSNSKNIKDPLFWNSFLSDFISFDGRDSEYKKVELADVVVSMFPLFCHGKKPFKKILGRTSISFVCYGNP